MNEKVISFDGPFDEQGMFDHFGVDPKKWNSERRVANTWTTSMRGEEGPIQVLNQQSKLRLKRRYPEIVDELANVINGLVEPRLPFNFRERTDGELLAVLTDFDAHINKLDIVRSNPKAKMKKIIEARKRILDKLLKFDPSRILMVHGGDEIETDGRGATTKGTNVAYNMHEYDAVKLKTEYEIGRYEYLVTMMDLDVITVSGNHDEMLSQMMAEIKKAYFRNTDNINLHNDDNNRAYYDWGQSLLMFAHGDHVKPNQMLQLATEEFISKKYKHKHGYVGHLHSRATAQNGDMIIKRLSTPSMPTKREKRKGFPSRPGIQGFLHSKKNGEVLEVNEYF